jgi:hypothetical protein
MDRWPGNVSYAFVTVVCVLVARPERARGQAVEKVVVLEPGCANPGRGGALNLCIGGTEKVVPGQEFRFSLCTGAVVPPGAPSPVCHPTTTKTIGGGVPASYVFSPAPATFLPRGLKLDAHGVLSGKTDVDLNNAVIRVCVRQLNAEFCRPIGIGHVVPAEHAANVRKDGRVDPAIVAGAASASGAGPAATGGGGTGGRGLGTGAKAVLGVTAGVAAGLSGWYFAQSLAPVDDPPPVLPPPPPPPPPGTSCSFQSGCILDVLYDGTLARATNFNIIFSTPSGTCVNPRTVCYGPGCDGAGTTSRGVQLFLLPRSLGTVSVSLAQAPSTTPSGNSRTVNLTTCQPNTIRFP